MSSYDDFSLDLRSSNSEGGSAAPAVVTAGAVCTFTYAYCLELSLMICDTIICETNITCGCTDGCTDQCTEVGPACDPDPQTGIWCGGGL